MSTTTRPVVNPTVIRVTGDTQASDTEIVLGHREAIAMGLFKASKVLTITGRRIGVSLEAEAWRGTAARPVRSDTPGAITVSSTSVNDTAAGTRARSVAIEYLDAEGYDRIAVASLNGLSSTPAVQAQSTGIGNASSLDPLPGPVPATGIRIQRAYVTTVGGPSISTTNEGTISIFIGGAQQLAIAPTDGFSRSSWVTVPRGMIGLAQGFGYSIDRNEVGRITPYVRRYGFPLYRMTTFEASRGALTAPTTENIRIASLGEFGLTFTKDGGGVDIDVGFVIQVALHPSPADPDPNPELQAPPFG